jgi:dihydrofolate reductase
MTLPKCSAFIASSLDGYIARTDGNMDWLRGAAENGGDYGYQAFFRSIDCIVIGRKTYEKVLSFGEWPYNGKKVVVLTTTPKAVPEIPALNVEAMSSAPSDVLERLKGTGCTHAYIDGGKTVQAFLRDGLIDEITITTVPIILGDGVRLFGKVKNDITLRHLETRTYTNGFVQTRYARAQET